MIIYFNRMLENKPYVKNTFADMVKGHKLYTAGTWLSLTITAPPKLQGINTNQTHYEVLSGIDDSPLWGSYHDRKKRFVDFWLVQFFNLWHTKIISEYAFNYEISQYGLMHFHGKVLVNSPAEFANAIGILKYGCGYGIDLDTMADDEKWFEYCSKDILIHGPAYCTPQLQPRKKRKGISKLLGKCKNM